MGVSFCEMFWDIAKELVPTIRDALKDGIRAALRSKRKRQHQFVIKAITANWGHWMELRFTMEEIDRLVKSAQVMEAGGDLPLGVELSAQQERSFSRIIKSQKKRLGLPGLHDNDRRTRIEEIVQDLCEDGKLLFWPPRSYSIPNPDNRIIRGGPWH